MFSNRFVKVRRFNIYLSKTIFHFKISLKLESSLFLICTYTFRDFIFTSQKGPLFLCDFKRSMVSRYNLSSLYSTFLCSYWSSDEPKRFYFYNYFNWSMKEGEVFPTYLSYCIYNVTINVYPLEFPKFCRKGERFFTYFSFSYTDLGITIITYIHFCNRSKL